MGDSVKEEPLPEPFEISAYITNAKVPMTHYVRCPTCHGRIGFNLAELEARRERGESTSVYCAGIFKDPLTDPHHYHPEFPPEPIYEFEWVKHP